ncbi:MAG: hypothetical protein IKK11_03925 [Oscillospiraceae bacterium]|nr:hypothetical protein [Oscillospiraceae bacterium]
MVMKETAEKIKNAIGKYKYAFIILCVGLLLLLLPERKTKTEQRFEEIKQKTNVVEQDQLSQILQSIEGAGQVQVMLSVATGEKTVYQTNRDTSTDDAGGSEKIDTVILTDSQRNESGLIKQIDPPAYLGAIVVCQGANNPSVKLAITQAVAKITGLRTDNICVLKMK